MEMYRALLQETKVIIKKAVNLFLYFTGVYFIFNRLFIKNGVYILFYHRLSDATKQKRVASSAVSYQNFDKQLDFLSKNYKIVSMDEVPSLLRSSSKLSEEYMVITFDDGYRDNLTYGSDIFSKYNLRPTIYLTVNCIENQTLLWFDIVNDIVFSSKKSVITLKVGQDLITKKIDSHYRKSVLLRILKSYMKRISTEDKLKYIDYMISEFDVSIDMKTDLMLTWDQSLELLSQKVVIGSHTMTHPILSRSKLQDAEIEISEPKRIIEEKLDAKVEHFAYPNGHTSDFNDEIKKIVSSHYATSVTTITGINKPGCDMYELKRIYVGSDMNIIDFKIHMLKIKIKEHIKNNGL